MSLTVEMLKQNPALAGVSDDALKAVAEMSVNDENTVIGTKIGELHGQYDADIISVTGIAKKDGEKSYDYNKRVLNDYKSKLASKTDELKTAKTTISELEAKIEKSGDAALQQQLRDSKAQVEQLQQTLTSKENAFASERAKFEQDIKNTHVDYAFQAAASGLKFKPEIPETVQKVLLQSAKAEILAKGTPDLIDDGQGGKTLALRGADGNILNNPKNNLHPYTIGELLSETSIKDVIDTGRRQTGGGTTGGSGGGSASTGTIDLSGAKTQIEADKMIERYLYAEGLTRDSQAFSERSLEIRNENNVGSLPIR